MIKKVTYKRTKFYNPTLVLTNNTGADVQVQVFNKNNFANNSSFNAFKQYQWNITAETFVGALTVSIQVQTASGQMQTITTPLNNLSVAGLIAALNALNIGIFYSQIVSGSTFVNVWNDKIIYGTLTINLQSYVWNVTRTITVNNPLITVSAFGGLTDQRSGQGLGNDIILGPIVPPVTNGPNNFTTTFTANLLNDGDTILYTMIANPAGAYNLNAVIKENGVTIVNSTIVGSTAVFSFIFHKGSIYETIGTFN